MQNWIAKESLNIDTTKDVVILENPEKKQYNIVASNGSPNGLEMIKKGEIVATASIPVSLQGLYIFKAMYLYAAKGLVPPSKHIVIDDMMIDKNNIDEAISWIPSDKLIELIGGLENWDTKDYGQYLNK